MRTGVGLILALGLPFAHLAVLGRLYPGLGPRWGGETLRWILLAVILAYELLQLTGPAKIEARSEAEGWVG